MKSSGRLKGKQYDYTFLRSQAPRSQADAGGMRGSRRGMPKQQAQQISTYKEHTQETQYRHAQEEISNVKKQTWRRLYRSHSQRVHAGGMPTRDMHSAHSAHARCTFKKHTQPPQMNHSTPTKLRHYVTSERVSEMINIISRAAASDELAGSSQTTISELAKTSYWLAQTSYWLVRTSYWLVRTSYCLAITSYWLVRTSYWLVQTSYWLVRTSYCLVRTSY